MKRLELSTFCMATLDRTSVRTTVPPRKAPLSREF
jgi:hypothetical protein